MIVLKAVNWADADKEYDYIIAESNGKYEKDIYQIDFN